LAQSPPGRHLFDKFLVSTSHGSRFVSIVSLAVLLGSSSISYTVSKQSDMFIYAHIRHNIEALVWLRTKKFGTPVNAVWHSVSCPVLGKLRGNISKILAFDANVDLATLC
jgi:hypothetical protein